MKKNTKTAKSAEYTSPQEFHGKIPLQQAIPLGLQHVLAMFVGNLTPLMIICGSSYCAISTTDPGLYVTLLQNTMLAAGLITLIQLWSIGPIGGQVPVIMGTSSGFLGVMQGVASNPIFGGGVTAYAAILGAGMVGGVCEAILGFFIKPLRKFFPPVVTGTVVLSIGLSLISVGVKSFAGGGSAKDFGSIENLLVGLAVLIVLVALKHFTKGLTSTSCILFAIIFGYILCSVMALILPTTATAEVEIEGVKQTVEYTKAWVLDWSKVSSASWFSIPKIMPVKPVFHPQAILSIIIMFLVTAVETLGDISGCIEGGMGREATAKELSGGIVCDGTGSFIASFFGCLPTTSFSQNVGLVAMTKVVNRMALTCGAVFLVLAGLSPKLAAVISIMPQSVLGGAAVMMFASIAVSGIKLLTKYGVTNRTITIVSIAMGLGFGLGATDGALNALPTMIRNIFGGSGIVPAAVLAIILNVIIPKEQEDLDNEAQVHAAEAKKA